MASSIPRELQINFSPQKLPHLPLSPEYGGHFGATNQFELFNGKNPLYLKTNLKKRKLLQLSPKIELDKENRAKKIAKRLKFTARLRPVSPVSFIQQTNCSKFFKRPFIVQENRYRLITTNDKYKELAAYGVGPCFAIASIAENTLGNTCLALSHTNHAIPIKGILSQIEDDMEEKGCSKDLIRHYVIGGQTKDWNLSGTEKQQKEVLEIQEKNEFNIVECNFNITKGEESLDIVLTKNHLFYSKEPLFKRLRKTTGYFLPGTKPKYTQKQKKESLKV